MAIDVSTFGVSIPAGTYTAGDRVELANIAGPAVVRSGRGAAILKKMSAFSQTTALTWAVYAQNSDWVDSIESIAVPMSEVTAMELRNGAHQSGHDCPLTPNSSWHVWAVCLYGGTTTVDNAITFDIEIDYPSVSAIVDPSTLAGIPCSIEYDVTGLTINAAGNTAATWQVFSTDIFKAGYEYALEKIELFTSSINVVGYVALSNAAGMGGLTRIIPIASGKPNIRPFIEYASKLVKGPMDIKFMLFNPAGPSGTDNVKLIMDFVKRRV